MREAFAQELANLENRLEQALNHAAEVITQVAPALAGPSKQLSAELQAQAKEMRAISRGIDGQLVVLTARQTPVAADLRLVLALVQVAQYGGLIANQFVLISEQLDLIVPAVIDRDRTGEVLARMTGLASSQLQQAVHAFASRDEPLARRIELQDDEIDRLNRQVFEAAVRLDATPQQRELGMRQMLIARSLERIGDNAVDIAEQAAFLVSAELQEFTDASHPRSRRGRQPGT